MGYGIGNDGCIGTNSGQSGRAGLGLGKLSIQLSVVFVSFAEGMTMFLGTVIHRQVMPLSPSSTLEGWTNFSESLIELFEVLHISKTKDSTFSFSVYFSLSQFHLSFLCRVNNVPGSTVPCPPS